MTYNSNLNYCTYSPDKLFGVKFNYACYLHDRQYRNQVENRKTRKQADKDMMDLIFKYFKDANKKFKGFIVSRIYYYAVRIFCRRLWK